MLRVLVGVVLALAVLAAPAQARDRTLTYRAGPYTLASFQTLRPKVIVPAPPMNGFITRMHAKLVDGRGNPVLIKQVMLHHVVFINQGRFFGDRKPKCGTRFGEPFYGTGEENQSLDLAEGYGYRIRRGDRWKMQTMLMSHNPRVQKVYVQYKMRVTQRPLQPVTPYWVRVTHCRNESSYSVPGGGRPGAVHYKSNSWHVPADGLIVGGAAHLHGGAFNITLRQMRCRGRRLMASDPAYGMPDDVVYNVQPMLHEPGPVNTAWFTSKEGIPVHHGERLYVTAAYDGQFAHPGVMGVYHVYIAEGGRAAQRARAAGTCPPLPADAQEVKTTAPVRESPPHVVVPLTKLVDDTPTTVEHPDGRLAYFSSPFDHPVVSVDNNLFKTVNLSIAAGTTVTWSFDDWVPHKVSLANGPRSMGSPTLSGGAKYARTFTVPGVYQLFCYLHPMTMHQELTVRPGEGATDVDPEAALASGVDEPGDYY